MLLELTLRQAEKHRNMKSVGARLSYLMKRESMTQAVLANMLGVTSTGVSYWLNDKVAMPQVTAMALQVVFHVRWQWILSGTGEQKLELAVGLRPEEAEVLKVFSDCPSTERQRIISNLGAMIFLLNDTMRNAKG
jgi:transcriptional regulator with XRE-family HTH domain